MPVRTARRRRQGAAQPVSEANAPLTPTSTVAASCADGVDVAQATPLNRERPPKCCAALEVGSPPVQHLDASLVSTGRSDREFCAIHASAMIKRCQRT